MQSKETDGRIPVSNPTGPVEGANASVDRLRMSNVDQRQVRNSACPYKTRTEYFSYAYAYTRPSKVGLGMRL